MYVGIDVGTKNLGWAEVNEYGDVVDSASIKFDGDLPQRFEELTIWCHALFRSFPVGMVVGLECPWAGANIQTALKLGEAKGIIRAAALWYGCEVIDIAPTQAKKALTGRGNANKEEMLRVAKTLSPEVDTFDAADAIGVALAVRDLEMSGEATIK